MRDGSAKTILRLIGVVGMVVAVALVWLHTRGHVFI
jgi:uncharacterized protein YjeT (DUF2065 family)